MIAALLSAGVAFQLAAGTLSVRDAHHTARVPLVSTPNGPMVSADALARALPITTRHDSSSGYVIEAWGSTLSLEIGTSTVRVGDEVRPLATPPTLRDGKLLIPLQLVSEVFPLVVPNTRWDPDAAQLVIFGDAIVGAERPRAAAPRTLASDAPAREPRGATSSDDRRLPPPPAKHNRRTVIVDAGHGGVDNGMTGPLGGGPRIYEKDITLAVAMKLGKELESRGVDVVYTRTADTLIALDDRGRIANRASGDLFISIHVNAANPNWKDPGGSRGFETYFLSEAKTEDARRVEHMENESVRFEDVAPVSKNDPLSFILSDMQQNEHLRESSQLAELIQQRLGRMHPGPSRGVKQAGFRVLVTAYMPAVLVEIGFGTNPREAAYLSSPDKQSALADAIADAAMDYLGGYERRVAGSGAGSQR
jgi:N-acetylmuramoyl-L-alanine amidase